MQLQFYFLKVGKLKILYRWKTVYLKTTIKATSANPLCDNLLSGLHRMPLGRTTTHSPVILSIPLGEGLYPVRSNPATIPLYMS